MDLIDKKILCELEINCRQPLAAIAKRLHIHRNVVAYRISNLEKEGIITNYICSINLGLFGYKSYKIYVKIQQREEKELAEFLAKTKNVIHLLALEGMFNYAFVIAVENLRELDIFLIQMKNRFAIQDYHVTIVVYTKVFKLDKLLLGKREITPKVEKYSGEASDGSGIQLDVKDKKILRELSQQGNMPLVDIANKTKLSLDIVKYRLSKLRKSVITACRITFDLPRMGFYFYRVLLRIRGTTQADEEKLVTWCMATKNVLYCTKQIGYFDFEINVAIHNIEEYNTFITALKDIFGEFIVSYEVAMISKLLKLDYVPF